MSEFIRFLVVSNLSLLVVWLSYRLFLHSNTFHGLNRAYLLTGSVVALIIPLLPFGMDASVQRLYLELPAFEVGTEMTGNSEFSIPLNLYLIVYVIGALVALWFFFKSVSSMVKLLRYSEAEIVLGELVYRTEGAGPFSFLSIIHLPKKLSTTNLETILKHEMAHVQLGHSYDVLWLSFLRILFWFNPLLVFYMRSLQEIHEYQADALTHISSTKEHYVKVQLDQLFQLPSDLSFANSFYNSINLKKRVNMIYSERTSNWGRMRYLVVVPVLAVITLFSACTESGLPTPPEPPTPPSAPAKLTPPKAPEVSLTEVDVMAEFPGGMNELMAYMGESINYPKEAEKDGVEGKVFVQFVIDNEGNVTKVVVKKGVHPDLDAEAVRVVNEMPKWTPAQKDGKSVSTEMTLPISYVLE